MVLSNNQREAFLILISQAFMEIRSFCRKSGTDEQRAKAFELADGFHNIPTLISQKNIDSERLLVEFSMLGEEYRKRALNIINSEDNTDESISLPKNQIEYITNMLYEKLVDMGTKYSEGRHTLQEIHFIKGISENLGVDVQINENGDALIINKK